MKKYFERIYNKGIDSFYNELKESLKSNKKGFIVTANPETFMISEKNEDVRKITFVKVEEILGFKINHSFLNENEFEKVWL